MIGIGFALWPVWANADDVVRLVCSAKGAPTKKLTINTTKKRWAVDGGASGQPLEEMDNFLILNYRRIEESNLLNRKTLQLDYWTVRYQCRKSEEPR